MDSFHDISRACEAEPRIQATPNQIWCKSLKKPTNAGGTISSRPPKCRIALIVFDAGSCSPGSEHLPLQRASYSESTYQSLQFDVQGLATVDPHRSHVSIGIAPNYGDFYPIERNSVRSFPGMRWKVEESSTTTPSWSSYLASFDRSGRLTITSPVLANTTSVNLADSMTAIGAERLSFDRPTSEAMAKCEAFPPVQTSFKDKMIGLDLNGITGYEWSQQAHELPTKRESSYPSTTSFDLSRVRTPEPSSRGTETQVSIHTIKSRDRYICSICYKSHTRPSRAIACENGHWGYQPFACDGTCDNLVW
ncbi:hypothetical protein FRB91_002453 [Serendipita sp. 411]|nr:hypothetical protein FRB91_002453 [Serendipita sp. 411]